MFMGVVLLCGLQGIAAEAVEGCVAIKANRLFPTEEQCYQSWVESETAVVESLPEGVYVADMTCVKLTKPNV